MPSDLRPTRRQLRKLRWLLRAAPAAFAGALLLIGATGAAPRQASGPPDLDSAAAELSWDDTAGELSWYYTHPGDYNQDGLVTVSDITPLGQNFGAEGPFAPDSALSVVDGNSDGFITVSDITPIGQNFSKSLERYQAFHSLSAGDYPAANTADNGGGATLLGTVQLINNPLLVGKRRHFTLTLGASAPTDGYGWVRPLSDEFDPGTPSNRLDFSGSSGNNAPVASLVLSATDVPPGTEVSLTATASTDADGDTLSFSFDPEGDGSFMSDIAQDTLNWTYRTLGDLSPAVRVSDGNGGTDEESAALTVSLGTLEKHIIDTQSGNVTEGFNVALVISDGRPGVLYYDPAAAPDATLRWRGALTEAGDSWGDQRGVDDSSPQIDAAVADGNPCVAYSNGDDILYSRAATVDGNTSWGAAQLVFKGSVHSATGFMGHRSLAIINGQPAMAGVSTDHGGGGDLFYARAFNADGSTWPISGKLLIDADTHIVLLPALHEVNGLPAIAYLTGGFSNNRIWYLRASDGAGTFWQEPSVELVPLGDLSISTSSLEVVAGHPACVFWNDGLDQIGYVRALDSAGTSWGAAVYVAATEGGVEGDLDLAVINDTPVIAYGANATGLHCLVARDAAGENWNPPQLVDAGTGVGTSVRMVEIDGRVAMAYYNLDRQNIEFVVYR